VKKAKKEGQWRNEDELRAYAEGMVGRMEKETWKNLPIGKTGGGSGSGAGGGDSKIRLSAERTSPELGVDSDKVAVKIFGTTSGAPSIMRPLYFNHTGSVRRKEGKVVGSVSAIPVSFEMGSGGELILNAKQTKEPSADKSSAGGNKDSDSETPMTEKAFNELPSVTFRGEAVNPALEAIATDRGLRTPAGLADVDAARKLVIDGIREREAAAPKKKTAGPVKPLAKGSLDDI